MCTFFWRGKVSQNDGLYFFGKKSSYDYWEESLINFPRKKWKGMAGKIKTTFVTLFLTLSKGSCFLVVPSWKLFSLLPSCLAGVPEEHVVSRALTYLFPPPRLPSRINPSHAQHIFTTVSTSLFPSRQSSKWFWCGKNNFNCCSTTRAFFFCLSD